jgi:hypothetical protein
MTLTTLGALLGLALAATIAWWVGGSLGTGILCGCACGEIVTGAGLAWQRRVLAVRPKRLMLAATASFLIKLATILVATLALRALDAGAEIVDWRGFLVAFPAAAVLVLLPGTLENMRQLRFAQAGKEASS